MNTSSHLTKKELHRSTNHCRKKLWANGRMPLKNTMKPRGIKTEKQKKLDAEDAVNKAADEVKKNRIKKLQWYTDTLNKRNYYTSATKLLIVDGKKALKKVEGYSEYDSMKTKFEEAVARAEALPVKAETPVVPTDGSDNSKIDSGKYSEATATPEPTVTPEPTAEPQ